MGLDVEILLCLNAFIFQNLYYYQDKWFSYVFLYYVCDVGVMTNGL